MLTAQTMGGAREAELIEAASLLMEARRTLVPIDDLPAACQPKTVDEAFFVQSQVAEAFGGIGGWKVGPKFSDGQPNLAPMPLVWMGESGGTTRGSAHRMRGVEAEIAFVLGQDLPARSGGYRVDEVIGAVASCHPAIEVVESGLTDPAKAAALSRLADLQMHGRFVHGPACPGWTPGNLAGMTELLAGEKAMLAINGMVRQDWAGSEPAKDLPGLLLWLANEGAVWTGGLKAGQWITTGSWTGCTMVDAGSSIDVRFSTLGRVTLHFE